MTPNVIYPHTCKKAFTADLFSGESLQLFRPPPKPISHRRLKKTMVEAVRAHTLDLLNNHYLIGGQIITPQVTLIDWLTITIPDQVLFHGLKRPEDDLRHADVLAVYTAKAEQLAKLAGLRLATTMQPGRNRYQYRYDLLANDKKRLKGAFVTFGGNGGLCLSLSAQACRIAFATEERFSSLGSQLVRDHAQISMIHVALDANQQEFTAASVVEDYRADKTIFRVRGKAGRLPRMEWTTVDEPTGERINHARVGSKAKDAKKIQTVYEKPDGRTRAELRLKRDCDRDIPISVIFETDALFAGAYIHNETLLSRFTQDIKSTSLSTRFKTVTDTTLERLHNDLLHDYHRLCANVRQSYGKQVHTMMLVEGDAERVVDQIARPGLPDALIAHQQVLQAIDPTANIIDVIRWREVPYRMGDGGARLALCG